MLIDYQMHQQISILILCNARRTGPSRWRQIPGATPQPLQEGETECLIKSSKEDAIHAIQEGYRGIGEVFQYAQPQGLMGKEQGLPAVEGGNGDIGAAAELLYALLVEKVISQYSEDKT